MRRAKRPDVVSTPSRSGVLAMLLAAFITLLAAPPVATAQVAQANGGEQPAAPSNLQAHPLATDAGRAGRALRLTWDLSPDDDPDVIKGYRLYRATDAEGSDKRLVRTVEELPPTVTEGTDEGKGFRPLRPYYYFLVAVSLDDVESQPATLAEPAIARISWFDPNKGWFLFLTIIVSTGIIFYIYIARTGVDLKIRKIAGLEAVDEAVGRATEMGRPILFVPGIQDMNNIQTVAGLTVLSRIGQMTAEYDARIEVPTSRSLVMTTARETLESSYLAAGRPDAYHEDMSYYVTDEQFGYVAYLAGYMSREKPAACFYLGAFFAESLILAETGNSIGAIQVAGTAEPAQLPFFVAACDYTLIGEEFFAASAYLSGEPEQLGTLKGQDVGKVIGGLLIIVGCLLFTAANMTDSELLHWSVNYLRFKMLGTEEVTDEMLAPPKRTANEDPENAGEALDGNEGVSLRLEMDFPQFDFTFSAEHARSSIA